jgi:hypothetical protein
MIRVMVRAKFKVKVSVRTRVIAKDRPKVMFRVKVIDRDSISGYCYVLH